LLALGQVQARVDRIGVWVWLVGEGKTQGL
jgi:hypothetical protein